MLYDSSPAVSKLADLLTSSENVRLDWNIKSFTLDVQMRKKTFRLCAKPLQYLIKSAKVKLRETKVLVILKKENPDRHWTCLQTAVIADDYDGE